MYKEVPKRTALTDSRSGLYIVGCIQDKALRSNMKTVLLWSQLTNMERQKHRILEQFTNNTDYNWNPNVWGGVTGCLFN